VVIDDLHIFCPDFCSTKTDAPLIVDTNAVLAGTVALQRLEAISGWHFQIIQSAGNLELSQFAPRDRSDVHESPDVVTFGERLGIGTPERSHHTA